MEEILEDLKNKIDKYTKSKFDIHIFDELKSSNTTLKSLANKGCREGTIVIVRTQSEGRGTQGRKFYSPYNGLYLSLLIRPKCNVDMTKFITVATVVAVVKAIKSVTKIQCGIKWVNDIVLNNKKIGGILTEGKYLNQKHSLNYAVVGIGLNLSTPSNGFGEIDNIAGALFEDKISDEMYSRIVAKILNNAFRIYKNLNKKRYLKYYKKFSILKNREINYLINGQVKSARVLGIDNNAQLILKSNDKILQLSAGEISLQLLK